MLNGKHKIRIALSHNLATRYIPTNIIIDAENEFKNGKVVKRPDKDILNAQLKKIYDMYYERCMKIEYANTLTCTQLIKMITKPITGERNRKFEDIVEEFLSQIDEEDQTKTYKLYKLAANRFLQFTGPSSLMEHITPVRINNYLNSLKREKLSGTTINIYTTLLKVIINYAIKMRYVEYKVDPFVTAKIPSSRKRDTYITVEQLKKIRDMEPRKYNESVSCYNTLTRKLDTLKKIADIKHDFTLYSARKSFVQHGFDLGIPLSTLEYCIGQSMKEDRPIFNYVTIMKKHADKAIREILDNLK